VGLLTRLSNDKPFGVRCKNEASNACFAALTPDFGEGQSLRINTIFMDFGDFLVINWLICINESGIIST
jgi:hypothetical protein